MQQGRRRGRQHTGYAQTDQHQVKPDDLAVVAVDAAHERVAQTLEREQRVEILAAERDVCLLYTSRCV